MRPDFERALVAFLLPRHSVRLDRSDRGKIMVMKPGGRIEQLSNSGLPPPTCFRNLGIMVWEGRVWLDSDPDIPPETGFKSGTWWDGDWRQPTEEEWELIKDQKAPWYS